VEDSGTIHRKRVLLPKEGEGVGGSIDMKVTIVRELKVGPYRFRNVPTYIFDDDYNVTSYPYLAGIIGNDIFRRFNSIINYAKRDIYLVPNSHFRDPFDYSYAGVELYYEKGKTVLGDVAANSPAEKAGLQEGDEVVGINNNFSQNFDQYKALLQSTVGRIKMIIRRNEELMQFEFKVKSIIQRKKLSFRR
jgi:membrane-associated protease RseP (regulator of RpoE activity)